MDAGALGEAVAGGLLLFVVPGFAVARSVFPEWRFRGPDGARRALETATLSFVLSIALTVLVGTALLGLAPGGFSAAWSDPLLEALLAAIAAVAFVAGWARGAYARVAPPAPTGEPADARGEEHAWELTRQLDRLHREDRALARRADGLAADGPEAAELARERSEIARRIEALEVARENEYAR